MPAAATSEPFAALTVAVRSLEDEAVASQPLFIGIGTGSSTRPP